MVEGRVLEDGFQHSDKVWPLCADLEKISIIMLNVVRLGSKKCGRPQFDQGPRWEKARSAGLN